MKASVGEPAEKDTGGLAEEHRNHADSVLPGVPLPSFSRVLPFSADVLGVWADSISALRIPQGVRAGV